MAFLLRFMRLIFSRDSLLRLRITQISRRESVEYEAVRHEIMQMKNSKPHGTWPRAEPVKTGGPIQSGALQSILFNNIDGCAELAILFARRP
jgi:hypothetical protein